MISGIKYSSSALQHDTCKYLHAVLICGQIAVTSSRSARKMVIVIAMGTRRFHQLHSTIYIVYIPFHRGLHFHKVKMLSTKILVKFNKNIVFAKH
jgi:hypothetical protein